MRSARKMISLAVVGFAILVGSIASPASAEEVPRPKPAKAVKGEQCVAPVDLMRREHMNLLKHQRDETLRDGIRGNKYRLNACIDCHATKSPDVADGKIRTIKPFCAECHEYAAVTIDCFQCHTGTALPENNGQSSALPTDHPKVETAAVGRLPNDNQ